MKLDYDLDGGACGRAAFGVVVLQSDETLEVEFAPLFQDAGIGLYHSRIPFADAVNPDTLSEMKANLPRSVSLFPSATPLDVIAYACTSGTTVIGIEAVENAVRSIQPQAKVTNPVSALLAACTHLGVRRLGFLTPYLPAVSTAMQKLLISHGLEVEEVASFEQESDRAVARIALSSVLDAICRVGDGDVDAVFTSCTNLRTFPVIEEAERRIGKPVLTSNQVLAWHMLELAGLAVETEGPGRLFAAR
jgi:maleate isomerase